MRASVGLPANIQENTEWSDDCAQHNNWMQLNDDVEHDEASGSPGYTADGAWAAMNSVLAAPAVTLNAFDVPDCAPPVRVAVIVKLPVLLIATT